MTPYYSANIFFKEKFNTKIIKIALDGGFTCPNRDGSLSTKGCIFCSSYGSGDFAGSRSLSITEQFYEMKEKMNLKWKDGKYMAYFQAFTNTYASAERLKQIYTEAINLPDVVALSIATRPDCVSDEVISLLKELSKKVYVCVELGLQTSNPKSAEFINRCYENNVYEECVKKLKNAEIDVITHIIIGLPNETAYDVFKSVDYAVECGTNGLKLQLLHVLKGTRLAEIYIEAPFKILSLDEYADIIVSCIERIPKNIVIHRITGDGPKNLLIEPRWTLNKKNVLNTINKLFNERKTFQGNC